jgi:hypothetical protein
MCVRVKFPFTSGRGDSSRRPTTEQGRQGQNISGMLRVLFGSIALAAVG